MIDFFKGRQVKKGHFCCTVPTESNIKKTNVDKRRPMERDCDLRTGGIGKAFLSQLPSLTFFKDHIKEVCQSSDLGDKWCVKCSQM